MRTMQCPGCGEVLDLVGGAERKPLVDKIERLQAILQAIVDDKVRDIYGPQINFSDNTAGLYRQVAKAALRVEDLMVTEATKNRAE